MESTSIRRKMLNLQDETVLCMDSDLSDIGFLWTRGILWESFSLVLPHTVQKQFLN